LLNRGVAIVGANAAGFTLHLLPAFGTLLAIVFLGESFHPYHAAASPPSRRRGRRHPYAERRSANGLTSVTAFSTGTAYFRRRSTLER